MAEHTHRKRARDLLTRSGYKTGGHLGRTSDEAQDKKEITRAVHEHESHLHKGEKKTPIKLADGGIAHGMKMTHGGRKPRGGKKGHTTVNVVVAGQHPDPKPIPVPVPVGAGPGGPGGSPPPGMGPGGPPMPPGGPGGMKRGGRAKPYPIDDGAGGGEGRREKAKAYGA